MGNNYIKVGRLYKWKKYKYLILCLEIRSSIVVFYDTNLNQTFTWANNDDIEAFKEATHES